MGLNRILLAEKDMEYGSALAAAISNLHNFEITVLDLEKYCSGREKGYQAFLNGFDLILVGGYSPEALEDLHFLSSNRNKLVLLMEYPAENLVKQTQNENRKCWYLYKYVRISELTSDLNFISTLLTGRKRFIRESISPDMIGFYSAGGGVGKTALAIAAARELSRYHDKRALKKSPRPNCLSGQIRRTGISATICIFYWKNRRTIYAAGWMPLFLSMNTG